MTPNLEWLELIEQARGVARNAYVPFSHFHVGAALRTVSGKVYVGANIENSSYPMSRCAEQSAIQSMASSGERGFTQIAVYSESSPPASPCGGCRQVLFEFSPEAHIYCFNDKGEVLEGTVKEFLPHGFRLEQG
ncbi:MAG: cytidine deaminase [Pseudopedobacter sp.]|nr:cytidine deaminase [Deinococcales bacterium]